MPTSSGTRRLTRLIAKLLLFHIVCHGASVMAAAPIPTVFLKDDEVINATVSKGGKLKLMCGGLQEITEEARTTWLKNNITLRSEELPTTLLSRSYLLLNRAKMKDAGIYECQVRHGSLKTPQIDRRASVVVLDVEKNETNSIESSEYDYDETDDYDFSDEEAFQEKQDVEFACSNMELGSDENNSTYLCIDLENKKEMNHYMVRPAGGTAILYCHAKGNPPPSIKWFKDGIPVSKSYQHKIQKNALVIEDLSPADEALYSCNITNNFTTIEYEIRLDVPERSHARPIFVETPGNISILEGQTVEFNVRILSDPEYSLTWVKHDSEKPKNTSNIASRTVYDAPNPNPDALILENVTKADEGWYSCIVGNSVGRAITSSYLHVLTESDMYEDEDDSFSDIMLSPSVLAGFVGIAVALIISLVLCFYVNCCNDDTWCLRQPEPLQEKVVRWSKQIIIQRRDPVEGEEEGTIGLPDISIRNVENVADGPEYYLPMDNVWEFSRENLTTGKKLGEGAFGEVVLGQAHGLISPGVTTTVAVKRLKKAHTDADLVDLLSECEIMKEIGTHVNVLSLLGCCTQGGELLVLTEFALHGNLRDYLRTRRHGFVYDRPRNNAHDSILPLQFLLYDTESTNISFNDLMSFSYQVARGMEYLTLKKFVHRDLAARNVLVGANKVVKIGDFGMARNTFSNDYYRKKGDGRVPVKWMAPETLLCRYYSSQSDVWAYGVLLWEIVTLGGTPYPSLPDVSQLLDFLNAGRRMEQPINCPTELYLIMRDCWHDVPSSRPSFGELVDDIQRILNLASGIEYLELDGLKPFDVDEVITPASTPENSDGGIQLHPDFVEYINERN